VIPSALAQQGSANENITKLTSVSKGVTGNTLPATVISVTNTNDSGPGSLRDALAAANDGDTIDATGVSGTILLTSGELQINHNVTINGPGAGNLAVNGNAASRVFENFASNVTISGFTITNGFPSGTDGGGGVLNHGRLTLSDSSIDNNHSGDNLGQAFLFPAGILSAGGGVNSVGDGTLTVTNSVVSGNSAGSGGGGGIALSGGGTLTVANSTISGNSRLCTGSCSDGGIGGGGTVTVTNSVISGNVGGIGVSGTVTVSNSQINGNLGVGIAFGGGTQTVTNSVISGNTGGGIFADAGTATVSNSTISGNQSGCFGGGINTYNAQLTVTNSTISGNSTGGGGGNGVSFCATPGTPLGGGGIACRAGTLTVMNSTISGNNVGTAPPPFAYFGGGILNEGNLTVTNSTISDNTAANPGGAIYNSNFSGGGTANIGDTVLNAGASGGTIFNDGGTITSLGSNLASDDGGGVLTGPGDQINTDPMLGPLQDNGGPTFTHALLPGSPAINTGDPNFTPPPDFDQRGSGFPRVVDGRIDKGSFEVQSGGTPTPTPTSTPTATPTRRATPTPRLRPTPAPRL